MMKDTYQVPCLEGRTVKNRDLTVRVPGSKSITNRALLFAMLADGECRLDGALFSEDSRYFLKCLQSLGFVAHADEDECSMTVRGLNGKLPCKEASLYVGSAGTAARFLTACLGLSEGTFHMDASEQMKKRPMAPLLSSLEELGCQISYKGAYGYFPFTLNGSGFHKERITIDIETSSQFLSALLIASVLSPKDLNIEVNGSHGMAYVDMTLRMMNQFGIRYLVNANKMNKPTIFTVPAGQHYIHRQYQIEPDVSAACYFYGLAAMTGLSVTVEDVFADSMQGDLRFIYLLVEMGCTLQSTESGLCLTGPEKGKLRGIAADMSACSDQAITLAAIAPFANSPVTITGIGHIRYQESDRIHAIVENLTAMGVTCKESEDKITIYPGNPHKATIKTYDDHRLAMGFSLTGLGAQGITIENPGCCRKTFEKYFDVLDDTIKRAYE
ncbi:MAG TPA: 3-phosphoshikimate 1-carboxyvinyltransferase [Lachnospiraceae bacterium]|nr:3-phosphoshikimate 1-carboxyvinyltransferase [Lachnospiraceae bacterium]